VQDVAVFLVIDATRPHACGLVATVAHAANERRRTRLLVNDFTRFPIWVTARHRTSAITAAAKNLTGAFGRLLVLAVAVFAAPARTLPPLVAKHNAVARWAAQRRRDVFGSFDAAVLCWVHDLWRHAPTALIDPVTPPQERPALLARRVRVVLWTPQFVAAAVPRLRLPLVVAALALVTVAYAVAAHAAENALAPELSCLHNQAVEHGQRTVDYEHAVSAEMGSEIVAVSPGYGIQVRMRVNSMADVVNVTETNTAVSWC
jgi:hypothetical protein